MIELRAVSFKYGSVPILADFSCRVSGSWPVVIMGSSGCGKSTLLRLMAGLEHAHSGDIVVGNSAALPTTTRVFYGFQDFDAFPWLTVRQNVDFVVRHRRTNQGSAPSTEQALALVGLSEHSEQYPRELSGGMRKRLALARAAASRADILLLDEPFSSLDVTAREEMYTLLMQVCSSTAVLPIVVTHAVEEAVFLGTRILVCDGPPLRIVEDIDVGISLPRRADSWKEPGFDAAYRAVQGGFLRLRQLPGEGLG